MPDNQKDLICFRNVIFLDCAGRILEQYLYQKSGVDTSHGICPECYKKQMEELKKKA